MYPDALCNMFNVFFIDDVEEEIGNLKEQNIWQPPKNFKKLMYLYPTNEAEVFNTISEVSIKSLMEPSSMNFSKYNSSKIRFVLFSIVVCIGRGVDWEARF